MKTKKIETLINAYLIEKDTSVKMAAFEELMRRIIFRELNESDTVKLFVADEIGRPIKDAIIKYNKDNRKILFELFKKVKTFNDYVQIKKLLGDLTMQEIKSILFDENNEYLYYVTDYAIEQASSKTLVVYLKRVYKDKSSDFLNRFIDRFLKRQPATNLVDQILLLGLNTSYVDKLIPKASTKALIQCLTTESNKFRYAHREEMKNQILSREMTEEVADFILNFLGNEDSKIILKAINLASKETVLKYFSKQVNPKIIEVCLKRLENIMQSDK